MTSTEKSPPDWRSWPQSKKISLLEEINSRVEAAKLRHAKLKAAKGKRATLLAGAIEAAIASRQLIGPEQEKLRKQAAEETDPVRRAYIEWQHDLVEWQLTRAADEAERRKEYLAAIRTPADIEAERRRCQDVLHWVKHWAWTLDPRTDSPLAVMPFVPFPIQERAFEWLDWVVFDLRSTGVQEKSRDMGATWINVTWAIHKWLNIDYFQALFSSRTEDEVDSSKKPATIFQKLRFQVEYQPEFLLPRRFDWRRDSSFLILANPENGSVIAGGAPVPDLGRGGRYTVAFPDEFASFPFRGNPQYMSLSQVSRSVVVTSTPKGKGNRFYELTKAPGVPVFRFYWRDHPWKDQRWRDGEPVVHAMKPAEVAQEIEIDYEASETGQLLREFDEITHVITWEEFAAYFGDVAYQLLPDGRRVPRLPAAGRRAMGMDWGTTIGHPTGIAWVWRPAERMGLADSLFVYRTMCDPAWPNTPENWQPPTPRRIATKIVAAEREWQETIEKRLMSPEKLEERLALKGDPNAPDPLPHYLQLPFEPWVARNSYGFPQLQDLLAIDWEESHPFRRYPAGHRDAGKPLPGRPRIYLISDSAQGALHCPDGPDGTQVLVRQPTDDRGHARLRAEIPEKRRETDTAGDEKREAKKIFDDVLDGLRGVLSQFGPGLEEESAGAKAAKYIDEKRPDLAMDTIKNRPEREQVALILTRMDEITKQASKTTSRGATVVQRDVYGNVIKKN